MPRARTFLDANVIFSASYREGGTRRLWSIPQIELCTSPYAAEEVLANITEDGQRAVFNQLMLAVKVFPVITPPVPVIRQDHGLPTKDQPILWAAIDIQAQFLITGDFNHFGRLMGRTIEGVRVATVAEIIKMFPQAESHDELAESNTQSDDEVGV